MGDLLLRLLLQSGEYRLERGGGGGEMRSGERPIPRLLTNGEGVRLVGDLEEGKPLYRFEGGGETESYHCAEDDGGGETYLLPRLPYW